MLPNLGHVQSLLSCEMLLPPSIEIPVLLLPLTTRSDATRSFIKVSSAHVCVYMHRSTPVLRQIDHDTEQMVSDLKDKQIEIIALMNSWVFSRLIAENERAGESLSREMDTVAEAEREQGMSPPASCSCSFLSSCLAGSSLKSLTHLSLQISSLPILGFWHLP
jgi:hypothetical protein